MELMFLGVNVRDLATLIIKKFWELTSNLQLTSSNKEPGQILKKYLSSTAAKYKTSWNGKNKP